MKLLQINVTANWGSTGRIAEQIGQKAISQGWESYIAYGRYANPSKSKLIKIGSKIGVLLHVLESRIFDNHGLASRIATKRLVKQIRDIQPDIIHLHNIHGYYLNYKILFEYLNTTNIPIVWTLHDCWTFTGHCAHFVSANCMRWKDGECERCPLSAQYPKAYADFSTRNFRLKRKMFTLNPNVNIVTVSMWLQNLSKESFLKNSPIRTIHNGIDLQTFNIKPISQNLINIEVNDKIVLGVASVWTASKGLDDIKKLRKLLPIDIKILLIGLTSKQIHSLPNGIIGIERTQDIVELAGYYTIADVFINPTYADTFPTTNLEAMACGTPVITYRTGGSPEAVTAETGFVVEQGDVDALAVAIKTIADNGKEHYSKVCRLRAERFFDKDKTYQQYMELYYSLTKREV